MGTKFEVDNAGALFATKIGVGLAPGDELLSLDGAIVLGDSSIPGTAAEGTLRFAGGDFQGRKGGLWVSLTSGGGVGSSTLEGLTDTSISGLGAGDDGKVLTYDFGLSTWVAAPSATDVASLTDVLLDGLAEGDALLYDADDAKWINIPETQVGGCSKTLTFTAAGGEQTFSLAGIYNNNANSLQIFIDGNIKIPNFHYTEDNNYQFTILASTGLSGGEKVSAWYTDITPRVKLSTYTFINDSLADNQVLAVAATGDFAFFSADVAGSGETTIQRIEYSTKSTIGINVSEPGPVDADILAVDSAYVYANDSQPAPNSKLWRFPHDLSSSTTYQNGDGDKIRAIYSDDTDLFVLSDSDTDKEMVKFTVAGYPTPSVGPVSYSFSDGVNPAVLNENSLCDDGSSLIWANQKNTRGFTSDSAGSPSLSVGVGMEIFRYKKANRTTLVEENDIDLYSWYAFDGSQETPFVSSPVYDGSDYYILVHDNPGKLLRVEQGGLKEKIKVDVGTGDTGGSLDGTYFVIQDKDGSVAVWFDQTGTTPEPVHGADRAIKITSVAPNDDGPTVSTKLKADIGADSEYTTDDGFGAQQLFIEDTSPGTRAAPSAGTSGFIISTHPSIGTVSGTHEWEVLEALAMSIDTSLTSQSVTPSIAFGEDSRIYVAGKNSTARFSPGGNFFEVYSNGERVVDATADDMIIPDNAGPSTVKAGSTGVFAGCTGFAVTVPPPLTPTNCRVSMDLNVDKAICVAWDSIQGNIYKVEVSTNGVDFFETIRPAYVGKAMAIEEADVPGLGYLDFTAGNTFYVRVRALNASGISDYSNVASVSIALLGPPLSDQTGLSVTGATGSSVDLQWTDTEIDPGGPGGPSSNRGHTVRLYRTVADTPAAVVFTGATDVVGYTSHPFVNGDNVEFVTVTGPTTPALQTSYYVVNANPNDFQIALTEGGTPVDINADGTGTAVGPFAEVDSLDVFLPHAEPDQILEITDTNSIVGNTTYHYFVRATSDTYLPSADSNVIEAVTLIAPPSAPTSPTSIYSWEGPYITWTPGVGGGAVDTYEIEYSQANPAFSDSLPDAGSVSSPTTEFTHAAVTRAANNSYRIRAVNGGGDAASGVATPYPTGFHRGWPLVPNPEATVNNDWLVTDGSYLYSFGTTDGANDNIVGVKVDLSNSRTVTSNTSVYSPASGWVIPRQKAAVVHGGFIYGVTQSSLDGSRILKIDPAGMTVSVTGAQLATTPGGARLVVVGGTLYLVYYASSTIYIDSVDTTTLVTTNQTSFGTGAVAALADAIAVGSNICLMYKQTGTGLCVASQVTVPGFSVTNQTLASNVSALLWNLATDGTNLYVHYDSNGSTPRVTKMTLSPLSFTGLNTTGGDIPFTTGHAIHYANATLHVSVSGSGVNNRRWAKIDTSTMVLNTTTGQPHHGTTSVQNSGVVSSGNYMYWESSGALEGYPNDHFLCREDLTII